MTKNDQQGAHEKLLSANQSRMIDSVKFAERKNAALLTFCSVWIGAIINALKLRSFHSAAVLVLGVCICMAVSTALWIGQQTRFVFLSTSPSAQAPTP